jgi:hypothetical protein
VATSLWLSAAIGLATPTVPAELPAKYSPTTSFEALTTTDPESPLLPNWSVAMTLIL